MCMKTSSDCQRTNGERSSAGSMDGPLFFFLALGGDTEQRFLVSSASVQITSSPLSWLADEDRINRAVWLVQQKVALLLQYSARTRHMSLFS